MLRAIPVVFAIALCIAILNANEAHPQWLQKIFLTGDFWDNTENILCVWQAVRTWVIAPVCFVTYSLWCSRLMTDAIASLKGRLGSIMDPMLADSLSARHRWGTIWFSGFCSLTGAGGTVLLFALLSLISALPGIMANSGVSYGLAPSHPALRATSKGIRLAVMGIFLTGLALIAFSVFVGLIEWMWLRTRYS